MKEIIIIISILIIIFTGSIVTQKYLNRTSDLLVDDLEDIKNDLEKRCRTRFCATSFLLFESSVVNALSTKNNHRI